MLQKYDSEIENTYLTRKKESISQFRARPDFSKASTEITQQYQAEAASIPLFTPEEETYFCGRAQSGDAKAKEIIIEANLRLVVNLAVKSMGRGVELPDLINSGNIGLMTAVERFDVTKGFKFSTYATPWINNSIWRDVKNNGRTIRVPVHAHDTLRKCIQTKEKLEKDNQNVTEEQIAEASGIKLSEVQFYMNIPATTKSLDTPVDTDNNGDGDDLINFLSDTRSPNPDLLAEQSQEHKIIARALNSLDPAHKHAIEMRYGLNGHSPSTLTEIADELGVTKQRVSQIQSFALSQLSRWLNRLQHDTTSAPDVSVSETYLTP